MHIFSQELNLYGPTPPTLAFLIPQPSLHVLYSVASSQGHDTLSAFMPLRSCTVDSASTFVFIALED